jgi:flagellar protein FlaG
MADQVNLMGSLAPGPSLQLSVAAAPKPAPEPSRTANLADSPTKKSDNVFLPESKTNPETAVEHVNAHLQQSGTDLKMQLDKATGRTVYKIVNPNTGEVVLQVPSEEMLAMARNLRAMDNKKGASGVLVDKEG